VRVSSAEVGATVERAQAFTRTVIHVMPMRKAKQHVAVTIELTEADIGG
jgi:hypothetical protein